ncbi:Alpha/beta hydrolase fold-1 [Penicillium macrosclerotiorum]|uniref:Alpha/beta hydrolase fold-1 n=1 Tax=Penicillium macrosclerotiorum TaxID=303699 RepID=UPI0025483A6B|nr:Alpha/beta hydrolase fold-1 [Penicillium macrosclerotiorum]KAJ5675467.1 Alpha/beta hydrolase fold-1 [Penicillium macrosclerotiorum]
MVANKEKPAIVLVHGSYHTPAPYEPFMHALGSLGFETHCPQRPTCDLNKLNVGDVNAPDFDRGPPPEGFPSDNDDLATVREVLDQLIIQQKKKVLLIAHSAGGWAATQAAVPELLYKTRDAEGHNGGLIGIFYYSAFVIPLNWAVSDHFQSKNETFEMPPWLRFWKHGLSGVGTIVDAPKLMFNGLDAAEAEMWTKTLTATPIQTGILTNNAYATLPCAYVVLDEDYVLPKEYQEAMIAEQHRLGNVFTVYHAPTGHSAHLSWKEPLAEKVAEFVDKINTESL